MIIRLLALTVPLIAPQLTAALVVSNLTASQWAGTTLEYLGYDLTAPGFPKVAVTLQISSQGGVTWTVPLTSVSGAIGNSAALSIGKVIVWNACVDWPQSYSKQMRFHLGVDDGFSLIPEGSFTMGRTTADTDCNAPPITVTVTPHYIQRTETTKAQWEEVREWALNNGYMDIGVGPEKASKQPVVLVSWWDVVMWYNARSEKLGLTPVYILSDTVIRTATTVPDMNSSVNGHRLPVEVACAKASRGWVDGNWFPWGTMRSLQRLTKIARASSSTLSNHRHGIPVPH